MRSYLFLPSLILTLVLCVLPTYDAPEAEQTSSPAVPESQSHMITVSDGGISPSTLKMKRDDKLVFFLNDSTDSLLTISLKYSEHATHCSSGNLKIHENGDVRSTAPIAPKDFASSCFHDAGSYPFQIFGLSRYPQGISGTIVIE